MTTVHWFRLDLRLHDNPALEKAASRGAVVPVYIWAPDEEGDWPPGAASRVWLDASLRRLDDSLRERGSRLVIRRGPSLEALRAVARETGAGGVTWNRRYEPALVARDRRVKQALHEDGLEALSFNGSLLFEPWEVETKQGEPYKVFTPFYKACLARGVDVRPGDAPESLPGPEAWPDSVELDALGLRPAVPWDTGIQKAWSPGESGAWARLDAWRDGSVADYRDERDFPDRDGTSRLSPHLHFGEVGPAQVWHAVQAAGGGGKAEKGAEAWLRQVIWREFAHHLLYHFPHTTDAPMQEKFARFPWTRADKQLRQWQKGATGYPIVDAAMRALWETGWMHNRLRMVVASFLTKHLLLPWQEGARWFWDTLVDADLANNSLGWQWTAGCGADAAPYFRVFNPVLQGKKFDPEGHFVRRWVPELQRMPARHVHAPWEAPDGVLQEAAVRLGADYPHPMVDHGEARDRALEAWEAIK